MRKEIFISINICFVFVSAACKLNILWNLSFQRERLSLASTALCSQPFSTHLRFSSVSLSIENERIIFNTQNMLEGNIYVSVKTFFYSQLLFEKEIIFAHIIERKFFVGLQFIHLLFNICLSRLVFVTQLWKADFHTFCPFCIFTKYRIKEGLTFKMSTFRWICNGSWNFNLRKTKANSRLLSDALKGFPKRFNNNSTNELLEYLML